MRDSDCIAFLQWCLPRMGLRWEGFRRVRGTVCKRVARRVRELELEDVEAYRRYLAHNRSEWDRLDELCRIPISRFWRDRAVFEWLAEAAFPGLAARAVARADRTVRCWSAGCASGEEAYSLRIAWARRAETAFPQASIEIIATDVDETMIARARAGRYREGSLRELPPAWRERAFDRDGEALVIRQDAREGVTFLLQDLRRDAPAGPFDLVLCRNVAFTYFDAAGQAEALRRLARALRPDGFLIIGGHERLPGEGSTFEAAVHGSPIYRRVPARVEATRRA